LREVYEILREDGENIISPWKRGGTAAGWCESEFQIRDTNKAGPTVRDIGIV